MLKKLCSIILCFCIIGTIAVPAMATDMSTNSDTMVRDTVKTSETGYMEIEFDCSENVTRSSLSSVKIPFVIKQFENDALIQVVSGETQGDELIVTDYQNGEPVNQEVILISDRVTKHDAAQNDNTSQPYASVGTSIGYITYKNNIYTGTQERIQVYSNNTDNDNEAYTINGKRTDTLSVVVGIVASVISVFIPQATLPRQIAVAIISALGGSVAGGAIGISFSEDVAVNASYYDLTAYHASTGRYTSAYQGVERQVTTRKSKYYSEWFYDSFTPKNWKDNALAYWFWCDLFDANQYPLVQAYA